MPGQEHSLGVTFAPRFLREFTQWVRKLGPDALADTQFLGFLFGVAGSPEFIVQAFRPAGVLAFSVSSDHEWQMAFHEWSHRATSEPESAWLDILGWFSLRPQSSGELLASDVRLHNAHFSGSDKLAVIFHPHSDDTIAVDLYTNLPGSPLHVEDNLHVALRFSTDPATDTPIIRPKIPDQSFLRAYEIAGALDRAERWRNWKEKLHWLSRFGWLRR